MYISIHPDSEQPIYEQIHDQIVIGIASGQLVDGQKLDSVRSVAAEFSINPATVKKAYDQLKQEGIVESLTRSGSVIRVSATPTDAQRTALLTELIPILARAAIQGYSREDIHQLVDEIWADITVVPEESTHYSHVIRREDK